MLSDEQKRAILNSWTESRPGSTEVDAYPYVMEMIVSQVTLALTRPVAPAAPPTVPAVFEMGHQQVPKSMKVA